MEISYSNNIEQYIELCLMKIYYSRKHVLKSIFIALIPFFYFSYLCYSRYSSDIEVSKRLSEATSSVLLVYIICGILWVALLPILYWKLKSILITKEIENLKINYSGEVKFILEEDKLNIVSDYEKIVCEWATVKSIEQRSKFIKIVVRGYDEFIIPVKVFENVDKNNIFVEFIKGKIDKDNKLSTEKVGEK